MMLVRDERSVAEMGENEMSFKDVCVSLFTSMFVCSSLVGVILFIGLYYWLNKIGE